MTTLAQRAAAKVGGRPLRAVAREVPCGVATLWRALQGGPVSPMTATRLERWLERDPQETAA